MTRRTCKLSVLMLLLWGFGFATSAGNAASNDEKHREQQLRLASATDIKPVQDQASFDDLFVEAMKMSRSESTRKQAFEQFRHLAEAGHVKSMAMLGYSYEKHLGTHASMSKAHYWYQKAADHGDPQGNWYLYKIYMAGDIVPRDVGKACNELKIALSRHYHRVRPTYRQFCQGKTPPG